MKPLLPMLPLLAAAMIACAFPLTANAQWSADSTVNTPVCTTTPEQLNHLIVPDGHGGAVIAWVDFDPNTGEYAVRAQRLSAAGAPLWPAMGVAVCTAPGYRGALKAAADGDGGVFLTWQDNRESSNPDICAQWVDGDGQPHWATDGVIVCGTGDSQTSPNIAADGNGGAIVVWADLRSGTGYDPYAQRLDADGLPQWTLDGIPIATGVAENLQIVGDGAGGAFVAWHHYAAGQFDVYAQRVGSEGLLEWGASGVAVCTQSRDQLRPQIASDEMGGLLLAWEDQRTIGQVLVYAQRLDGSGTPQWTANGVAVAPNTLTQGSPALVADGTGGACIAWSYPTWGVYAQRLDATGSRQWAGVDGTEILGASTTLTGPRVVSDGAGGAIVAWDSNGSDPTGFDVLAQRVDFGGTVRWKANGIGVCRNPAGQTSPRMVSDTHGGAILLWQDARDAGTNHDDLYAQRIGPDGVLGAVLAVDDALRTTAGVALAQNHPNPGRGATTIEWRMPAAARATLELFDVTGRRVATLADGTLTSGLHAFTLDTRRLDGGLYYYRLRVGDAVRTRRMVVAR